MIFLVHLFFSPLYGAQAVCVLHPNPVPAGGVWSLPCLPTVAVAVVGGSQIRTLHSVDSTTRNHNHNHNHGCKHSHRPPTRH